MICANRLPATSRILPAFVALFIALPAAGDKSHLPTGHSASNPPTRLQTPNDHIALTHTRRVGELVASEFGCEGSC